MRNKYSREFVDYAKKIAPRYTKEKLMKKLERKYNLQLSNSKLEHLAYRYDIHYKEYKRRNYKTCLPIGTEKVHKDGTIYIKAAQPSVWRNKARVMYEEYHNCKLTSDEYIIFANKDKSDFSKENLMKVSHQEALMIGKNQLYTENKELIDLNVLIAKTSLKNGKIISENEAIRKAIKNEKAREYYWNNREKELVRQKRYRESNKEKEKARKRKYYLAHKKEAYEYCKNWRNKNRERYNQNAVRYKKERQINNE